MSAGRKKGVPQPGRVLWSAEDDQYLLDSLRLNLPVAEICASLDRSKGAVMSRQQLLRARGVDVSRPAPSKAGPRRCLRCSKTFASAGAHNRLCKYCRPRGSLDAFTTPARVAL